MKNFLKSKTFIISAVAALAVAGAVYGVAHFGDFPRFARHHMPHYVVHHLVDKMDHELDLSDAQQREIESVLNDTVRRFRDTGMARADSVTKLLNQPQLTAEDVRRAMQSRHADGARVDRDELIAEALAQVHAILTPPQRAALAELLEDKMARHMFREHRHFGRGWLH